MKYLIFEVGILLETLLIMIFSYFVSLKFRGIVISSTLVTNVFLFSFNDFI